MLPNQLPPWKVNPQPSTGPSAGRFSPDPEQHHPDLGTAARDAATPASPASLHGRPDAILIPASPSPSIPPPGSESPAFLHAQAPVAPELPWPLTESRALLPMDRPQSFTGMEPYFGPVRPHSPSGAYVPGADAEPHVEARHQEMVGYNFATFMHHPDAPMAPAGAIQLGYAHAEALIDFRAQVMAMPDQSHAYAQTYRAEDGRMAPVHPELVRGFMTEVGLPSGSYPAGTGLVIHSHPPRMDGAPARPSESDLLRAYHDRTNALQHPETVVAAHILYDRGSDQAFLYDGRLGPDGNPQYFHAIVPPHPEPHAIPADVPLAMPIPRRPTDPSRLAGAVPPTPLTEATPASPVEARPAGPQSPDWDRWMEFPPSTPQSPTPWNEWIDFGG